MKCSKCDGIGKITCPTCKGVGTIDELDVAYIAILGFPICRRIICSDCEGSGKIKCDSS